MEPEKETDAAVTGDASISSTGEDTAVSPVNLVPETPEQVIQRQREDIRRLTDQLLRKQAEMENARKRLAREKEEFLQFSMKQTVEALLPVLDGFELALANEGGTEGYRRGVELIYQQLASALQRMGVEPIQAKGQIFDPNLHEAVASTESTRYRDQEVIEELQKGYRFKNRLLRPARVRIAKNPSSEPEEGFLNLDGQSE